MNKIANMNRLVGNICRPDINMVSRFKTMTCLRNESQAFIWCRNIRNLSKIE